jgi:hypothetical protein
MTAAKPQLTVISNSEDDALKAYFRRLFMIEKYILQVMLESDVQIQYKLIHAETPRPYQGCTRFNGGIMLGFNPYNRLPSTFFTPLGAIDISRGFATHENAPENIARILHCRLGLTEDAPLASIVPGVFQRVFSLNRDPFGNPLPRALMLNRDAKERDPSLRDQMQTPDGTLALWERVRLREEPTQHEQVLLSLPRNRSHLQAVA